jgi:V8-like Glu-specific endopeptidase
MGMKKILSGFIGLIVLVLGFSSATLAQTHYQISSGTGFFVSMNGYVITNAHVVNGCEKAIIKGDMNRTVVDIIARDAQKDLALLRTDKMPQFAAPLRDNIDDLKAGDKALVMGYPGNHAITGEYSLVDTQVLDVVGPLGNPDSIQFGDSAQKGNSGGPLLDSSGNVIGVIVGKSEVYQIDPVSKQRINVRNSDLAISLSVLKTFLGQHGIYARDLVSSMNLSRDRIVDRAKYYIVNVQCAPDVAKEDPGLGDRIIHDLAQDPDPNGNMKSRVFQEPLPSEIIPPLPPAERNQMVIFDKNRDE